MNIYQIIYAVFLRLVTRNFKFRSDVLEQMPDLKDYIQEGFSHEKVVANIGRIYPKFKEWTIQWIKDHPDSQKEVDSVWEKYLEHMSESDSNDIMKETGPLLWRELHLFASSWDGNKERAIRFLSEFEGKLGCSMCKDHWKAMLVTHPPDLRSAALFFLWTFDRHNDVNRNTGKAVFDIEDANVLYPMDMQNFFQKVVLINLDRRQDRMEEFVNEIGSMDWPFRTPERFSAVDSSKLPVPVGWTSGGGAWGCMQSHRQILEKAISDGIDTLLVLEDDVTFVPGFPEKIVNFLKNVPLDWDQLMIGGQMFGNSTSQEISPGVSRVFNCQRTHCYAVRGQFMKDLYAKWCGSYGHCDHVMGPFQAGYNVYAPTQFLAGQREGKSDISGADNPTKLWIPPSENAPVFWLRLSRMEVEAIRANGYGGHGMHGGRRRNQMGIDVGLNDIVLSDEEFDTKVGKLKGWINMIQWEGRSMTPESHCFLWHPKLTEDLVKAASGGNLVTI